MSENSQYMDDNSGGLNVTTLLEMLPTTCSFDSVMSEKRNCDLETKLIGDLFQDSSILKASVVGCTGAGSRYSLPAFGIALESSGPSVVNVLKTLNLCNEDVDCTDRLGDNWFCDKDGDLASMVGDYWSQLYSC